MGESCCLPWLLPGTGEIAMRTAIRERYGIRGNILDDASMLCWCHCCTLCQMAREVRVRKNMINVHTSTTTAYAPVSQY
ncbi:cornifelin homolog [Amia ocellicauda]